MFCLASSSQGLQCALATTGIHVGYRAYYMFWSFVSAGLWYAMEAAMLGSLKYTLATQAPKTMWGIVTVLAWCQRQTTCDLVLPLAVGAPLVGAAVGNCLIRAICNRTWILRVGRCILYSMVNLETVVGAAARGAVGSLRWLSSSGRMPLDDWEWDLVEPIAEDMEPVVEKMDPLAEEREPIAEGIKQTQI